MGYIGQTPTAVPLNADDLSDDIITLAKMASGTDGNLITYDASGNPAAVATGNDGQVLTSAGAGAAPAFETLSAGKILQVVATDFSDTFSSTSPDTFADISGFSRTITCSATSSKVLIMVSVCYKGPDSNDSFFRLVRDSTAIAIGDADGSRERCWFEMDRYSNQYTHGGIATLNYVDSPSSTSELDYKLQIGGTSDSSQIYINRGSGDADSSGTGRGYSSIICMEIGV